MNDGLATSSASSLRTNGCISSGPMDLCTSRFLRCSQTWLSPTAGSSFSQSLPLLSVTCAVWLELLLVKMEAKKLLSILGLFHVLGDQVSHNLPERNHIFRSGVISVVYFLCKKALQGASLESFLHCYFLFYSLLHWGRKHTIHLCGNLTCSGGLLQYSLG